MRSLLEIKTRERHYAYKRLMSGSGYWKRDIKKLGKALRGSTHHLTMHSSCGTSGRAGSGRALGCKRFAKLWLDLSSNHTPSPGAKLRQGDRLWGPVQRCRECETVIRHLTDSFIRD